MIPLDSQQLKPSAVTSAWQLYCQCIIFGLPPAHHPDYPYCRFTCS